MAQLKKTIEQWLTAQLEQHGTGVCLAVSGAQGIGKSTALNEIVETSSLNIAWFGLDDVYLTYEERTQLAADMHSLFITRGPPGTHDVELCCDIIEQLKTAGPSSRTALPRFDKKADDRTLFSTWPMVNGTPDLILVDGWMMGALPDPEASNAPALNEVEAGDLTGIWRATQEQALNQTYAVLWSMFDAFLHIDAPDWNHVVGWRIEQEETTLGLARGTLPEDRITWVRRFVQHYERITRRMLAGHRCDGAQISVDHQRRVVGTKGF